MPELCCLGPSSLNRPHPPHSWAHRDFTAERLIRDVFAVRERRGDPRVVPSFRCLFLPDMPSSASPGSSTSHCPISRCRHGLRRTLTGSTLPILPQSVSRGRSLSRLHWFTIAAACQVARLPLDGSDWNTTQPPEAFTSRLPTGRSPFPSLDMTTTSIGLLCRRDLHPLEWQLALRANDHETSESEEFSLGA